MGLSPHGPWKPVGSGLLTNESPEPPNVTRTHDSHAHTRACPRLAPDPAHALPPAWSNVPCTPSTHPLAPRPYCTHYTHIPTWRPALLLPQQIDMNCTVSTYPHGPHGYAVTHLVRRSAAAAGPRPVAAPARSPPWAGTRLRGRGQGGVQGAGHEHQASNMPRASGRTLMRGMCTRGVPQPLTGEAVNG